MTWAQIATLIVSIAAVVATGTGVVVLSVDRIHSQVAADRAEAAADRRAWQATMDAFRTQAEADRAAFREEMRQLGERQARVEGALSTAAVRSP